MDADIESAANMGESAGLLNPLLDPLLSLPRREWPWTPASYTICPRVGGGGWDRPKEWGIRCFCGGGWDDV